MKKLLIILLVLLGIAAVAVVSCPDRQAHREAILAVVNDSIHEELKPSEDDLDGVALLFGSLGSRVAGYMLEDFLVTKNHFVCSTGALRDVDGSLRQVSFGVFGHVFTFHKEDIIAALN